MTDTKLIWKFLTNFYPNEHPIVAQYIHTQRRNRESIIGIISKSADKFFYLLPNNQIQKVVKSYLSYKEKDYRSGKININRTY